MMYVAVLLVALMTIQHVIIINVVDDVEDVCFKKENESDQP